MTAFWIEFSDRDAGCLDAVDILDATRKAERRGNVARVATLPHHAYPRLDRKPGSRAWENLCFQPAKCAGRTTCPRPIACDE